MLPVLQLYHSQFRVVRGTNPKKIPFQELVLNLAFLFSWRSNPNVATKGQEFGKVLFLSCYLKNTRRVLLSRCECICDPKVIEKRISPKLDIKCSTSKKYIDVITNWMMGLCNGAVLMQWVGPCWMYVVVPVGKYILDIRVGIQLATLI